MCEGFVRTVYVSDLLLSRLRGEGIPSARHQ
jgi:hypothetical protein